MSVTGILILVLSSVIFMVGLFFGIYKLVLYGVKEDYKRLVPNGNAIGFMDMVKELSKVDPKHYVHGNGRLSVNPSFNSFKRTQTNTNTNTNTNRQQFDERIENQHNDYLNEKDYDDFFYADRKRK